MEEAHYIERQPSRRFRLTFSKFLITSMILSVTTFGSKKGWRDNAMSQVFETVRIPHLLRWQSIECAELPWACEPGSWRPIERVRRRVWGVETCGGENDVGLRPQDNDMRKTASCSALSPLSAADCRSQLQLQSDHPATLQLLYCVFWNTLLLILCALNVFQLSTVQQLLFLCG